MHMQDNNTVMLHVQDCQQTSKLCSQGDEEVMLWCLAGEMPGEMAYLTEPCHPAPCQTPAEHSIANASN